MAWTTLETNGINGNGAFRYFEFRWDVASTGIGTTTIKWELEGKGGNTALSTFTLKLNNTVVLQKNNETVWYKDGALAGSGTITINHDADGKANLDFYISISKIWAELGTPTTQSASWALANNKPYSACYWGTNASVKINTAIQKPGSAITISWSGANAGTANPISGFKVEYRLDSGSWAVVNNSVAAASTSTTLTVPDSRGSTISARVTILSSISASYNSSALTGGSCKINTIPGAPSVSISQSNIPSTQATIAFTATKGSDPDGQTCSIKYRIGSGSTYYDYTSGSNISISGSTTYHFYTYDGLEYSSVVSKSIYKNSKPTVGISASTTTFNQTLTASKGNNGYTNNTYSFGYTYNGTDYVFSQKQSTTSYTPGDIRTHLSDKLGGLNQSTTYYYKYWVQRHDGLEDSNKTYTSEQSFSTPSLAVKAVGSGPSGYFGTNISFLIGGNSSYTNYYPLGNRTFNDTDIPRGGQISDLTLRRDSSSSQYFKLKLNANQKLTKVYKFDFNNLSIPSSFKPYSNAKLTFSMAARDASYGFSQQPTISYSSKNINIEKASSNNTWNYSFDPSHLWGPNGLATSVVNNSTAKKTVTLSVTNEFGEIFTKNCTLNFDFREAPVLENFSISISDGNTVAPLSKFQYIKEGVKIVLNCKVKSYNSKFTYKLNLSGEVCYDKTSGSVDSYKTVPWGKDGSGTWIQIPNIVELSESSYSLSSKNSSSAGIFTLTVTTASGFTTVSSTSIPIKRHISSQIHFTELNYIPPASGTTGTLTGSFVIDDKGYDDDTGGIVSEVYFEDSGKKYSVWVAGNGSYNFSINFPSFSETYKLLAPICVTKLSAQYVENGQTKSVAESTKQSSALVYLAVYNMLPTVAYRQNYIGINTNNPSYNGNQKLPNTAVTISGYNNNQKVYLVSGSHTSFIDLLSGSMFGFIVDGGSWDETSGEITIPGNTTIPLGLANIAYTGEIGDLEQERQDNIIFSGGGAPSA